MEHAGTAVAAAVRALAVDVGPVGHRADRDPVRPGQQRRRRVRRGAAAGARRRPRDRRQRVRGRPAARRGRPRGTGTGSPATPASTRSTCRSPVTSRSSGRGSRRRRSSSTPSSGPASAAPCASRSARAVEIIDRARCARRPGRRRRYPDRGGPVERRAVRAGCPGRPDRHLPSTQDRPADPPRCGLRRQDPGRAHRHPGEGRSWLNQATSGDSRAGSRSCWSRRSSSRSSSARPWRPACCRPPPRRSSSTRR